MKQKVLKMCSFKENINGSKIVLMDRITRTKAVRLNCQLCDCETLTEYLKCSDEKCPLHQYRLGTFHKGKAKAIRSYCKWCMGCDRGKYPTPITEIQKCPSACCPLYRYRMGIEIK